ncbi:MAG: antibiotic biosynthesis monooxygenase [Lentisphaeria bacterium]|nr:antibiotic biosynthesis monooxygenase [Lentisphaeria bacterium]
MIYVVATSEVKPECREKFIEFARKNLPNVHAEKGCIMYQLCGDFESGFAAQQKCGENSLVFIECWQDIECLKAHLATPHMKKFMEDVKDLRISSSLKVLSNF